MVDLTKPMAVTCLSGGIEMSATILSKLLSLSHE